MTKNVFIFGISGRMGKEIKTLVDSNPQLKLVGGYSLEEGSLSPLEKPDVIIDFSLPASQPEVIQFAQKQQCALVSGTTGLSAAQKQQLVDLGKELPIFWSANMSFGVYLMCQLTETLARFEQFYEFHIEETHHVHKKDKPSGTALIIEEAARRSTQRLQPMVCHRDGEVFGIHRFIAKNDSEMLEIRHEAFNRSLFAKGAIAAGLWLTQQKPGFYGMADFFKSLGKSQSH